MCVVPLRKISHYICFWRRFQSSRIMQFTDTSTPYGINSSHLKQELHIIFFFGYIYILFLLLAPTHTYTYIWYKCAKRIILKKKNFQMHFYVQCSVHSNTDVLLMVFFFLLYISLFFLQCHYVLRLDFKIYILLLSSVTCTCILMEFYFSLFWYVSFIRLSNAQNC